MDGERPPGAGEPRARLLRDRRFQIGVAAGAAVVLALAALSGIARRAAPTAALPTPPSPSPAFSPIPYDPVLPGATGSLIVQTGAPGDLGGGAGAVQLWRFDLENGAIERGPAVPGSVFATTPIQMANTLNGLMLLSAREFQASFLMWVHLNLSTAAPSSPAQPVPFDRTIPRPVAEATTFSVGSDGSVVSTDSVDAPSGQASGVGTPSTISRWTEDEGISERYARVPDRSATAAGGSLTGAYLVDGRIYATVNPILGCGPGDSQCSGPPIGAIAVVERGRLRTVLSGWSVVAPAPCGCELLVNRWDRPSATEVWSPDGRIRPLFQSPRAVVERIVAWESGTQVAFVGTVGGRPGLFVAEPGFVSPDQEVVLPPSFGDPEGAAGAWSGDGRYLFVTAGLSLIAVDTASGNVTSLDLPGTAGRLPVLNVVWRPNA